MGHSRWKHPDLDLWAGQHTWQISRSSEKMCKTADPGSPPSNWHEMLVGRDLLEVSVCNVFGVRERGDSLNPGDQSLRPCFCRHVLAKPGKPHHCEFVPSNICSLFCDCFLQAAPLRLCAS